MESLSDLFDNKWDDIIKDKQIEEKYKKKIKQIKIDYNNITTFLKQNYLNKDIDEILEDKKDVSILNENVSLVSKIYYGKNNPIEKLKLPTNYDIEIIKLPTKLKEIRCNNKYKYQDIFKKNNIAISYVCY